MSNHDEKTYPKSSTSKDLSDILSPEGQHKSKTRLVGGGVERDRSIRCGDESRKSRNARTANYLHTGTGQRFIRPPNSRSVQHYIQDINLDTESTDCKLVGMSFRQLKDWNDTKPAKPTLVQFTFEELMKLVPRIEGCIHEAGFSTWRVDTVLILMSKDDFQDWVAFRLRVKSEDRMLASREAADLRKWLPWNKNRRTNNTPPRMEPLEAIEKGFGL